MAFRPVIAVCDACVLYPFHLRNILVQASVDGLYDAQWTDRIHDEWIRNLAANAAVPVERLQATRRLMEAALPSATVVGYERHVERVRLPDHDDRHVVAAAIEARAAVILTWNLRDFPAAALKELGLLRRSPDSHLAHLYDQAPELMIGSLANARRNLRRSRITASNFVAMLRDQKLPQFESRVARHVRDL